MAYEIRLSGDKSRGSGDRVLIYSSSLHLSVLVCLPDPLEVVMRKTEKREIHLSWELCEMMEGAEKKGRGLEQI